VARGHAQVWRKTKITNVVTLIPKLKVIGNLDISGKAD
jgi:hypothetical protein